MKDNLILQLAIYASVLASEVVAEPMGAQTPAILRVFESCRRLAEDLKQMRFLPE